MTIRQDELHKSDFSCMVYMQESMKEVSPT